MVLAGSLDNGGGGTAVTAPASPAHTGRSLSRFRRLAGGLCALVVLAGVVLVVEGQLRARAAAAAGADGGGGGGGTIRPKVSRVPLVEEAAEEMQEVVEAELQMVEAPQAEGLGVVVPAPAPSRAPAAVPPPPTAGRGDLDDDWD